MALTNVREFVIGLDAEREATREEVRDRTRAAALYGLRNLIFGTRVDTGRARGNWQVAEKTPPQGHDPDLFDPTGQAAVSRGTTEILATTGAEVIWIHNGVPYIEELEKLDLMLEGTVAALHTWLASQ